MPTERPAVSPKPNIGPRSPIKHNFENPILPDPNSHYEDVQLRSSVSPQSGPAKSPLQKKIFKQILPKFSVATIQGKRNALNHAGARRPSAKFEKFTDPQVKNDEEESEPDQPETATEIKPKPQPRNAPRQSQAISRPTFRDKTLPSKVNLPSGVLIIQEFKTPSGESPQLPKRVPEMVIQRTEVLEKQADTNGDVKPNQETYDDVAYTRKPIAPNKRASSEIYEDAG